jgi:hypothetical protein
MEIDQDIQKIIDEYVEKIQDKENELVSFKDKVDGIISSSENELEIVTKNLDERFNKNSINEEEYIKEFRIEKENILNRTKDELNSLVKSLE